MIDTEAVSIRDQPCGRTGATDVVGTVDGLVPAVEVLDTVGALVVEACVDEADGALDAVLGATVPVGGGAGDVVVGPEPQAATTSISDAAQIILARDCALAPQHDTL